jgi:PAS domain S-box-containing protein
LRADYAYIMRRGVERAQESILLTDKPLSKIVLDCGLANQAHLTRLFRRLLGVSPGLWRRLHTYLRDARDCYLSWGADGKVRQLEKLHPHLSQQKTSTESTNTILASVERLDLATVIRLSQTISGQLTREGLADTLMRLAIQNAGAERGLLILTKGHEYQIVAEATASSDDVAVAVREASASAADLPISVLRYVERTKESVVQHDASGDDQFLADDYVRRKRARSILCLPLLRETTLVGALYLENNLAVNVFAADRIVVLKLLAAQAAISLENVRLYDELQDREGKIRRLFDSNFIGLVMWRGDDGKCIDANDAFLRIIGYGREAVESGLDWRELTPPEWHPITEQRVLEMRATGASQAYEKEYIRKDGSRVPVLCGTAKFDRKSNEGVAFVLNLTEQKRAERAYTQIQTELAHANRLATMGHLTASIAHEINQPIGAAITYANAGLNWLGRKEPNVEETRRALDLVVEAGIRAGAVVERIRALVKKAPPRKDAVDVNKVVREIIELTRREIVRNAISVRLKLTEGLPRVEGDHVQLQQVVLNLVMNAIEAMSMADKDHRELLVSSEKSTSDGVLVAVRDSGPGIAPESADRLYESFYTTKPAGLGMGLSICHSIIEAYQGRLWATANTPEGAVFQFTLPAK